MRGKASVVSLIFSKIRITPAYAGKSLPCFAGFIQPQDHPRLCGEKFLTFVKIVASAGSPPPMRGKVLLSKSPLSLRGITPAYAGKRPLSYINKTQVQGSPPPMRGKGRQSVSHALDSGITPAYAGKRENGSSGEPRKQDHPRLCGEKVCRKNWIVNGIGSPPPMRGKD